MQNVLDAQESDESHVLLGRAPDWLGSVARRNSRRAFDGVPVASPTLDALDAVCTRFAPYSDARVVLVREPVVDVFTGVVGSYGKVHGAPHVLVFVATAESDHAQQHLGFVGEAGILEATTLGLDTCWVGGFFDSKRVGRIVDLAPDERVFAVSPVGYAQDGQTLTERAMRGMAGSHKRKSVAEIAPGIGADWPDWAVAAVETARLAPSAVNRQPWRFRFEDGALVIAKDSDFETPKVTKRLDCGIAMLHAQLGAIAESAPGRWTDLDGLDVAEYRPWGDR